jgi:ribose transport system permease protein
MNVNDGTASESRRRHLGRFRTLLVSAPVWIAVVLLFLLASAISPAFMSVGELRNIFQITAFLGIAAIGQTIALMVGGIDLSIGGVVTLTNILATSLMDGRNGAILPSIGACLLGGILIGLVNGTLIAYLRVTPMIATLSTNSILFGIALVYTGGAPHGSAAPLFIPIGQGHIGSVPASGVSWIVVALAMAYVLRRTVFGRWVYAVGANPVAARLMGVPVQPVLLASYVLSSLMAVLCGLLITAYIGNPSLGIGDQFLLTSVAAAVVGGTALTGGVGSVVSTIGGALFIMEANSFTNIAHMSTGTQFIVQGVIIALSVLVYRSVLSAN